MILSSLLFALSFFIPLSLALTTPRRDPLHIPVIRRNDAPRRGGEVDVDYYSSVVAGLRRQYKYDSPKPSRRGLTSDIDITNQVRRSCIIRARIRPTVNQGSRRKLLCVSQHRHPVSGHRDILALLFQLSLVPRPQTFDLILDTGSSDLWFATTACTSCPSGTPEFDPTSSTSVQIAENSITLNYGSGTVVGNIAQDTITMGAFTVTQQTFGAFLSPLPSLARGCSFERTLKLLARGKRQVQFTSIRHLPSAVLCMHC